MTVEQSGSSDHGKHDPGFDLVGFGQLVLLAFLALIYPLLGMLWHYQYPVFSIEIVLMLAVFLLLAGLLSLLLPHSPLVYRQDCSLDYESESWLRYPAIVGLVGNSDETRRKRYEKFVPHAKCALRELGVLFKALQEQGLYEQATIVVHGDHGTSAYIYSPSAPLSY